MRGIFFFFFYIKKFKYFSQKHQHSSHSPLSCISHTFVLFQTFKNSLKLSSILTTSSFSSCFTLGNTIFPPAKARNINQLDVLNGLQIDFTYHVENEFDFIEDFTNIGWTVYFNFDQIFSLDMLVKEFYRYSYENKDGEVASVILGIVVKITQQIIVSITRCLDEGMIMENGYESKVDSPKIARNCLKIPRSTPSQCI